MVPLDSLAGPTAWRWQERVLGPELMTAVLIPRALNPLSAVTLGAMADMGYPRVNAAAADRYVVPSSSSAQGVRLPGRRPPWTRRIVDARRRSRGRLSSGRAALTVRRPAFARALAVLVAAGACEGDPAGPDPAEPVAVVIESGSRQSGRIGAALPVELRVRVVGRTGLPAAGARV